MQNDEENYLKQYHESNETINELESISNLEYTPTGELFSYTTDAALKIYQATASPHIRNIISTKIDKMAYFQNNTLLHSKGNLIFYLSVYDNKYLRRFEGHEDLITGFSVNPDADAFMSIGADRIGLWDIRYKDAIYTIDSNGKLGAMSRDQHYALCDNNFIYIYDWRNTKGPVEVKSIKPGFYRSLAYTADSSTIVVSTGKSHLFLDSKGDHISSFSLENSCDPVVMPESNIFLCFSSKMLLSYKIADKKVIGRSDALDSEYSTIRANPKKPQFICASESSLKVWSLRE